MTTAAPPASPPAALGRAAGALYLGIILCGLFAEFFVRTQILVPGDPAGTARNLAAAPGLYRLATVADLAMLILDVCLALALYVYFLPVSAPLSLLAAFLRLAQAAILGANLLHQIAAGFALDPTGTLAGLLPEQRDAIGLLFVELHRFGYYAGLVFFGASCLILGYLIIRAPYVPSPIGLLIAVAGIAYLSASFGAILYPHLEPRIAQSPLYLGPALVAEIATCLWLLTVGARGAR